MNLSHYLKIQKGLLSLDFRSNFLVLTNYYNLILVLELKEVVTATVGGEVDYKHIYTNHEDDPQ